MGIALVPETRDIFSYLTVQENLAIAERKGSRWQMDSVLERFPGAERAAGHKGRELSGGEQEMLAIARALMTGPDLLLLDEPSQGLAPLVVNAVMDTIRELKSQHVSMLLVEQNAEMALQLADRVYVIDHGTVVFDGHAGRSCARISRSLQPTSVSEARRQCTLHHDCAMVSLFLLAAFSALAFAQPQKAPAAYEPSVGQEGKDVVWVPTSQALVDKMLDMAKVTPRDFVMDLGSGDGRTVITAAKRGARAMGIEYNPDMVALSKANAEKEGVSARATFMKADLFETDLSKATVITMFLLPEINLKLRPKILRAEAGHARRVEHASRWRSGRRTKPPR